MASQSKPTKLHFAVAIALATGMICGFAWFQARRDNKRIRDLNDTLIARVSDMQSADSRRKLHEFSRRKVHEFTDSAAEPTTEIDEELLVLPPGPAEELPEFLLGPMNLQRATNYDRRQLVLPPAPAATQLRLHGGDDGPLPPGRRWFSK